MPIKNKQAMIIGVILAISFFSVLGLIFSPVFGDGKNGLVFSDDMFNKLSKGSSYFIPKVMQDSKAFVGKQLNITIKMEKDTHVANAVKVLTTAGATAEATGVEIKIQADLGNLMNAILVDSDYMYKNNGKSVADKYGFNEKDVMVAWWNILKQLDKPLKKEGKIQEAKIVSDVMKKAVETAHNFYGIEAQKVTEKAGIMTGLLVFYVLYTMWWGYAIFYLFEGLGFSAGKTKH